MPVTINGTTGETTPSTTYTGWTTATRPASPATGYMGYNTTTGCLDVYNGTSWTSIPMPTSQGTAGQVLQSNGSGSAPSWVSAPYLIDYLVVAGGGGSGSATGTGNGIGGGGACLLYTSPSPRDYAASRMPSSA